MSTDLANFTCRKIAIQSDIPEWNNVPAQTQNLALMVGEWGSPDATADQTYLLVHGITSNLYWWETLVEGLLAKAAKPIRLIAFDLRGRGDSDKPSEPYSVAVNSADLCGLLNALNLTEPINFVGHSLGAHIGIVFAALYPERVNRLILIDGGVRMAKDVDQSIGPALRRLGQVYPSYAEYVAPLKASGVIPDWTERVERLYQYDSHKTEAGVSSKIAKSSIDQELFHLRYFYNNIQDLYAQIKAPTVLVRANTPVDPRLSPFLPQENIQAMRDNIGGSLQVLEIDEANHYTVLLNPTDALIDIILND